LPRSRHPERDTGSTVDDVHLDLAVGDARPAVAEVDPDPDDRERPVGVDGLPEH